MKQLHILYVTCFGPLARPSSDVYNDKSLANNHTKTFYVYVGKISHSLVVFVIGMTSLSYINICFRVFVWFFTWLMTFYRSDDGLALVLIVNNCIVDLFL